MYSNTITLNTNNYDLVTQRPYSSVRSDSTKSVAEPTTLAISHEVNSKTGRRNSAIIIEDVKTVNNGQIIVRDSVKGLIKLQFNPYVGRTDVEADLQKLIADLIAFVSVPANIDKFLNLES